MKDTGVAGPTRALAAEDSLKLAEIPARWYSRQLACGS